MVGLGWPVLHLPKFFFLEFLDGDEIELALLMGEFSQADRAEDGGLLAVRVEADDLYLFVFVLLVHAEQLRFQVQL